MIVAEGISWNSLYNDIATDWLKNYTGHALTEIKIFIEDK